MVAFIHPDVRLSRVPFTESTNCFGWREIRKLGVALLLLQLYMLMPSYYDALIPHKAGRQIDSNGSGIAGTIYSLHLSLDPKP